MKHGRIVGLADRQGILLTIKLKQGPISNPNVKNRLIEGPSDVDKTIANTIQLKNITHRAFYPRVFPEEISKVRR